MKLKLISLIIILSVCSCKKSESTTGYNPTVQDLSDPVMPNPGDQYIGKADEPELTDLSDKQFPKQTEWPPSVNRISTDLVGHSISEATENGYHEPGWTFVIEDGDVSDIRLSEVLTSTDSKYLIVADMKLSKGGNYYYQTKVRINYIKDKNGDVVLDYVKSLGMNVVTDGEYDDDISCSNDGLFFITNNGEVALWVGGKVFSNSKWSKFSIVVPPHRSECPSYCSDYRIDFVARDY